MEFTQTRLLVNKVRNRMKLANEEQGDPNMSPAKRYLPYGYGVSGALSGGMHGAMYGAAGGAALNHRTPGIGALLGALGGGAAGALGGGVGGVGGALTGAAKSYGDRLGHNDQEHVHYRGEGEPSEEYESIPRQLPKIQGAMGAGLMGGMGAVGGGLAGSIGPEKGRMLRALIGALAGGTMGGVVGGAGGAVGGYTDSVLDRFDPKDSLYNNVFDNNLYGKKKEQHKKTAAFVGAMFKPTSNKLPAIKTDSWSKGMSQASNSFQDIAAKIHARRVAQGLPKIDVKGY